MLHITRVGLYNNHCRLQTHLSTKYWRTSMIKIFNTKIIYFNTIIGGGGGENIHSPSHFLTLCNRNMCPIVLRLLMNMYVNQKIQVRWKNILSWQHNNHHLYSHK